MGLEIEMSDSLKYKLLILKNRIVYNQGEDASTNDKKEELFKKACDIAESAKKLNNKHADGFYYFAISLARWAEARGIIASLNRKSELLKNLGETVKRQTIDGQAGNNIDYFGPDRVFGRMYFKLPGIFGGDNDKSREHLERAVKMGPLHPLNTIYLAETLTKFSDQDKNRGCSMLKNLLSLEPRKFNPKRQAENIREFQRGKQTFERVCK